MNKLSQIRSLWWIALLAGGFLVSLSFAFRFVREETNLVNRLSANRQALNELQTRSHQKLVDLAKQTSGQVSDLQTLLGTGKGRLKFSKVVVTQLPALTRHHKVTIALDQFPSGDLPALINKAENASPAWHLTSIHLVADNGRLQGELGLEALDKSPSDL